MTQTEWDNLPSQLNVKTLREALEGKPDDATVFFDRVAPICGNIEAAYLVEETTYGFFGKDIPCVIIRQCPPDPVDPEDPEGQGQ